MSSIDTYKAKEHWGDECKYLKEIRFAAFNSERKITLITDEEGNDEIVLTPRAAMYVATTLIELVKVKERGGP